MFYHDHAWGITRLNVYAGEAAGYLITDDVEQKPASAQAALLAGLGIGTPLDHPGQDLRAQRTPRSRRTTPPGTPRQWGGEGSLWVPHVYMPAQNPGDPTGMSRFGRWMYGPWFWPPATSTKYRPDRQPVLRPDLRSVERRSRSASPQLIPGTPNVSVGMEAFNDTPVVNGTAYPTTTVDPKAYRYRILNAANDRFWNLQWYVADPTTGTLQRGRPERRPRWPRPQTDPVVFPTPDTTKSPVGPSWIQIGTEGGFLPAPVVVPTSRLTWITDPTGSTSATSTSTRCCWARPSAPT